MIVVNLKGGLGNQMFQYALGYVLAKFHNTNLKVDLRYLRERRSGKGFVARNYDLDIFGITPHEPSTAELVSFGLGIGGIRARYMIAKLLDRISTRVITDNKFNFDDRVFSCRDNVYIDGYWQSEKYFVSRRSDIKQLFDTSRLAHSDVVEGLASHIRDNKSVCINVRRADFVGHPDHDVIDGDYFNKSFEELKSRAGNDCKVFIFSDDVSWCKENLRISHNQVIVEHDYAGDKFSSYLYLMTLCRHFIIPNSTFAWWAAWLSDDQHKIVIAPKRWYGNPKIDTSDLIPNSWERR